MGHSRRGLSSQPAPADRAGASGEQVRFEPLPAGWRAPPATARVLLEVVLAVARRRGITEASRRSGSNLEAA
jgi:hypothetical protein